MTFPNRMKTIASATAKCSSWQLCNGSCCVFPVVLCHPCSFSSHPLRVSWELFMGKHIQQKTVKLWPFGGVKRETSETGSQNKTFCKHKLSCYHVNRYYTYPPQWWSVHRAVVCCCCYMSTPVEGSKHQPTQQTLFCSYYCCLFTVT